MRISGEGPQVIVTSLCKRAGGKNETTTFEGYVLHGALPFWTRVHRRGTIKLCTQAVVKGTHCDY